METICLVTEKKAVQLKVQGKCEQESLSCENFRTMDAFIRHLRVTEEKPAVLMLDYDMLPAIILFTTGWRITRQEAPPA